MRLVSEHLNLCLLAVGPQPELLVNLPDASGCVLARDIQAPFDLPDTDLAALDGYALDTLTQISPPPPTGMRRPVLGEILAGDVDPQRLIPGAAFKIASGAALPTGCDAVVGIEHTDSGEVEVNIMNSVPPGKNVRKKGSDVSAGQVVVAKGKRLGARQIAIIAGLGLAGVWVHPRPRVVVVSIGDELVEPGNAASSGQVYDANGHALAAAARDVGAQTFRVQAVGDDRRALRETLEDQLVRADLIITTGGLSYGAGDTVKEVLGSLGSMRFDNVAISPGRQLGVGTLGEGTVVFALPGNPVAAQVSFEAFVRPALRKMAGWSDLYRPSVKAKVSGSWRSTAGRREFIPVHLTGSPELGYTMTLSETSEPSFTSLAFANAFAVVPEAISLVEDGSYLYAMVLD